MLIQMSAKNLLDIAAEYVDAVQNESALATVAAAFPEQLGSGPDLKEIAARWEAALNEHIDSRLA